jgi:hypothetical protein
MGCATHLAASDIDSDFPLITGFSFDDLTNSMLLCSSQRVVTILDSCYSGSLKLSKGLDSKSGEESAIRIANKIVEEKADKLKQGVGRCLLASSQGYEEAYDRMEKDHSIFTYYLRKLKVILRYSFQWNLTTDFYIIGVITVLLQCLGVCSFPYPQLWDR